MARNGGHSRRLAVAAGAAALALTWSSASWACTVFKGKMTITGKNSTMVTVVGNEQQMGYCSPYPLGKAKVARGGTITINVKKAGPDQCVVPGSRLPPGAYDVNYAPGRAFLRTDVTDKSNVDGTRGWRIDCMSGSDNNPDGVRLGTLVLDDLGKGTNTYVIPSFGEPSGPTDEAAICVSQPVGTAVQSGLQAPITVL